MTEQAPPRITFLYTGDDIIPPEYEGQAERRTIGRLELHLPDGSIIPVQCAGLVENRAPDCVRLFLWIAAPGKRLLDAFNPCECVFDKRTAAWFFETIHGTFIDPRRPSFSPYRVEEWSTPRYSPVEIHGRDDGAIAKFTADFYVI